MRDRSSSASLRRCVRAYAARPALYETHVTLMLMLRSSDARSWPSSAARAASHRQAPTPPRPARRARPERRAPGPRRPNPPPSPSRDTHPAGPPWRCGLAPLPAAELGYDKPLCASLAGFTLHAATARAALDSARRERPRRGNADMSALKNGGPARAERAEGTLASMMKKGGQLARQCLLCNLRHWLGGERRRVTAVRSTDSERSNEVDPVVRTTES